MNSNTKQYIIVGAVVLVLVVVAAFVLMRSGDGKEQANEKETVFDQPTDVIPTVDPSVTAEIKGNREAVLTIKGIPSGTEEIEYELSYNTASGSMEGVLGSITVEDGDDTVEEEFIFGTSSSGVNRYHEIEGSVKGIFKFSGEYGQQLLEKEFSI